MTRRRLFLLLAGLPFIGRLFRVPTPFAEIVVVPEVVAFGAGIPPGALAWYSLHGFRSVWEYDGAGDNRVVLEQLPDSDHCAACEECDDVWADDDD